MPRWVVSVESLAVPLRDAILKSLQASFDLVVADTEHGTHPFALLLHRMVALSKTSGNVLSHGTWASKYPADPTLATLHSDLARDLVGRLGLGNVHHLMVALDADVDEAFETMLQADPIASRMLTLQACEHARARLLRALAPCTPFPNQIVDAPCPIFSVDNPETLRKVLDLVRARCSEVLLVPRVSE